MTTTKPFRHFPIPLAIPLFEIKEYHLQPDDGVGDTSSDESDHSDEDPSLSGVPKVLDESSESLSLFQPTEPTESERMLDRVVNPILEVLQVRSISTMGECEERVQKVSRTDSMEIVFLREGKEDTKTSRGQYSSDLGCKFRKRR